LIAAGFTDITAHVVRFEKDVGDCTGLARGITFGSPLIDQIRARGAIEPEQFFETLLADSPRVRQSGKNAIAGDGVFRTEGGDVMTAGRAAERRREQPEGRISVSVIRRQALSIGVSAAGYGSA
jgi:hypothetical protein